MKKGKNDQAKGGMFTKAARVITIAVRQGGGDPGTNFALRLAIEKAKEINVPKDNIERAIKRGAGELADGAVLESVLYEGFAPGGVGILIDAVTDNRNRTVSEVKHLVSKAGGSIGTPGSVSWQFMHTGVVRIEKKVKDTLSNWDDVMLQALDLGVSDVYETEDGVELYVTIENFSGLIDFLKKQNIEIADSGIEWIPKEHMTVSSETEESIARLCENLEALDDVRAVYTAL